MQEKEYTLTGQVKFTFENIEEVLKPKYVLYAWYIYLILSRYAQWGVISKFDLPPVRMLFQPEAENQYTGEHSLIVDLSLCRRKGSPEGTGVVDLLDHLARLWLMRLESQGIFTWLHQDKLNQRTDQNLICRVKMLFQQKAEYQYTEEYSLIVDLSLCRRKSSL